VWINERSYIDVVAILQGVAPQSDIFYIKNVIK